MWTFNRLQPIKTNFWMVCRYFWNSATGNWNSPKFRQPQPKNRPDHDLVQFGPSIFCGPMDWIFKHCWCWLSLKPQLSSPGKCSAPSIFMCPMLIQMHSDPYPRPHLSSDINNLQSLVIWWHFCYFGCHPHFVHWRDAEWHKEHIDMNNVVVLTEEHTNKM